MLLIETALPFGLLVLAVLWRAASAPTVPGFGALCVLAVVWLGFYGTRRQVWTAVVGSVLGLLLAPLLTGSAITGDDLSHAALTGAVALLTGPIIHSLVVRQRQSAQLVSMLEPASLRLDAVLRAATGNMIVASDPDGIITDFNQGAERLLGYRADEVVGTPLALLFDDANPPRELGDIDVHDRTCRAKDGRRVTVSVSMSGMRNSAGTITGYVCIGADVTASRNTMMTLTSQRQLYQSLVENLPLTTVGLLDGDLRCVTLGGHWLRKIGAEPASFRGTPITDFFAPDDRERARELYTRGLREQVIDQWQLADGRWYEFSALPMTSPDGEQLVLSLARDVTKRQAELRESQRMHAALAVSESSFREAFEGAPIGMALTTAQDGPDEKFLRVNPAFAAILGRRPEDLVGRRVADVTHPEDVAMLPDLTVHGPAPSAAQAIHAPVRTIGVGRRELHGRP